MLFSELEAIINRLIKMPLKNQITVDFDRHNKIFRISTIIYHAPTKIPSSLSNYILAREGSTFQPHKTSFAMEDSKVHLIQEFPFKRSFQEALRTHTVEFWRLAKHCHQMFSEIAAENPFDPS